MTSRTGQLRVQSASFASFESYEAALGEFRPIVRKHDSGDFRGRLLQAALGSTRLTYTQLDASVSIEGCAPAGHRSFGLPLPASSPAWWCGQPTHSQTVSIYDRSGGFEAAMRPGFETVVLSVTPSRLAETGEALGLGERVAGVAPGPSVRAGAPARMLRLHHTLTRAVQTLAAPATLLKPESWACFEDDVLQGLLEPLCEEPPARPPVGPERRRRALRQALDFIHAHPRQALSVLDLCRATGASERTLRRAFVDLIGVPPKQYLNTRRLNGVYRELRTASPALQRVNDAAHCWGFWHMGQFAADFHRFFGELPSTTLDLGRLRRTREQGSGSGEPTPLRAGPLRA